MTTPKPTIIELAHGRRGGRTYQYDVANWADHYCARCGAPEPLHDHDYRAMSAGGQVLWYVEELCLDCLISVRGVRDMLDRYEADLYLGRNHGLLL